MKTSEKNLKPFLHLFRPHFRLMGLGTLLGWGAVVSSVGLLALSGWFISSAAFAGLSLGAAYLFNFFYPSAGVRLFAIARTLFRYGERLVSHDATFRMLATLRVWFYKRIEPLAPARLMQYRSADILNRIVADIDALDNLYVRVLSPTIVAIFTIVAVTGFLLFFDAWIATTALGFMLIAGIAVPLAAARLGARTGRHLNREISEVRIGVVEGVQGLSELVVYGAWQGHLAELEQSSQALIRAQGRMSRIRGGATAATMLLSGMAVLASLYLGVNLVEKGLLNGANLALIGFAVLGSFEALLPLPWAYQYLGQTRKAGQRLLELVDTTPPVVFPEVPAGKVETCDIYFQAVDFQYHESAPWVLKDFNLRIDQNRTVAIIGETGAGKSTLFNLLVRFWDPVNGSVCIGGHDITRLSESDLRQTIGVVSQQPHLFNATLRRNLLMARPAADESALKAALQKAQLLDFVETLPDGLETWIGEAGWTLSGGQARRLGLARLFLQNAPIWILDEPTEGLDRLTEQIMMRELVRQTTAKTLLLITHRTADLEHFDEIIMLDRGRIIARGSHAELTKSNARYAALQKLGSHSEQTHPEKTR